MVSKSEFKSSGWRSFSGRQEYEFAFQFCYCEPSVKKNNEGREVVVWSALIVGWWWRGSESLV